MVFDYANFKKSFSQERFEMIEIEITSDMIDQARIRSDQLGELKNSVTRGKGNMTGFLGELVANQFIGGEIKNTYDYDILLEDGTTIDVKSKSCNSPPKPHFECSISDYNTKQKCDKYLFVRVLKDHSKAWILGWIDKNAYYEKSDFYEQGQMDRSNGWRAKCDCWNLKIQELDQLDEVTG